MPVASVVIALLSYDHDQADFLLEADVNDLQERQKFSG
jgi:hypothetical protein